MKFKLTTPNRNILGGKSFQIKFEMDSVNEEFRDNVLGMILAALDGGIVQGGEVEEKPPALGFHKEDEDDSDA